MLIASLQRETTKSYKIGLANFPFTLHVYSDTYHGVTTNRFPRQKSKVISSPPPPEKRSKRLKGIPQNTTNITTISTSARSWIRNDVILATIFSLSLATGMILTSYGVRKLTWFAPSERLSFHQLLHSLS